MVAQLERVQKICVNIIMSDTEWEISYEIYLVGNRASFSQTEVLVQACLRAPHVVADEAKLAIVFTYFFFLLSPTPSAFPPLRRNSRD